MKQHITLKQLESLSPKAAKRLRTWFQERLPYIYKEEKEVLELKDEGNPLEYQPRFLYVYKGDESFFGLPYMTIGQMIEFLDEHYKWKKYFSMTHHGLWSIIDGSYTQPLEGRCAWGKGELCDALWIGVKEVLEKS